MTAHDDAARAWALYKREQETRKAAEEQAASDRREAERLQQHLDIALSRLSDREARLRDYRLQKLSAGVRGANIQFRLNELTERNRNQTELIRDLRSGAMREHVGAYRARLVGRLVRTLWASRRQAQDQIRQDYLERFDLL